MKGKKILGDLEWLNFLFIYCVISLNAFKRFIAFILNFCTVNRTGLSNHSSKYGQAYLELFKSPRRALN